MTLQEIFNKVARHLLGQMRRAKLKEITLSGIICAYKSEDGCKCAVGCLIPDNLYLPGMEGQAFNVPLIANALLQVGVDIMDYNVATLLSRLQCLHDAEPSSSWRDRLVGIARYYKLEWPADL